MRHRGTAGAAATAALLADPGVEAHHGDGHFAPIPRHAPAEQLEWEDGIVWGRFMLPSLNPNPYPMPNILNPKP